MPNERFGNGTVHADRHQSPPTLGPRMSRAVLEPRRRLEERKPVLEAATAHVKDVGRGTGAVEDVVVVQYEGSQVPLVVREDQSLGAAAATWCRAERPKDRHCVRALGVLAATSKLR